MPLDSHSYLTSQGWSGKGKGLRDGSLVRPLAIPRKRTLAGVGKDRDEAFPFWDHLFSAAAKAIRVRIASDHEDDGDRDQSVSVCVPLSSLFSPLKSSVKDNERAGGSTLRVTRTTTGIISNRRPATGTPAISGQTTPSTSEDAECAPRPSLNLLSTAKREAAKRSLYSRFFSGPVLGPDVSPGDEPAGLSEITGASVKSESDLDAGDKSRRKDERKKRRAEKEQRREERHQRKRLAEESPSSPRAPDKKDWQRQDAVNPPIEPGLDPSEKRRRKEEKQLRRREKETRRQDRRTKTHLEAVAENDPQSASATAATVQYKEEPALPVNAPRRTDEKQKHKRKRKGTANTIVDS
jgi:hypothetical protein